MANQCMIVRDMKKFDAHNQILIGGVSKKALVQSRGYPVADFGFNVARGVDG